jgi:hypothetical protein
MKTNDERTTSRCMASNSPCRLGRWAVTETPSSDVRLGRESRSVVNMVLVNVFLRIAVI